MKKVLYIFVLLTILASCDQVDKDDRYIPVDEVHLARKVLLQEFTGQRCVNCPEAHAVIEKLEEQYGDDLVVVSIHAGSFGIRAPFGLMNEIEGNAYADYWKVEAYPSGVVDWKGGVLSSAQWSAAIREDGRTPCNVELDIDATLSSDNKKINITSQLVADDAVSGKLLLWVVENGIVAYQLDADTSIPDYVHNNVFRTSVNGQWGEDIDLVNGESFRLENSVDVVIDPEYPVNNWNVNNLFIVGFVYNENGVSVVNRVKVN